MKGNYLHTERCGSYYVPCKILEYNVPHRDEFQYFIDKLFKTPLKEGLGVVLEFTDEFGDYNRIWTTLDRVKLQELDFNESK